MVALGLLVVVVLAVLALGLSALRTTSKSTSSQVAAQVLHRELSRAIYAAPGDKDFWLADYQDPPWKDGSVKVGADVFNFAIYTQTVTGTTPNRLKKVDAIVRWRDGGHTGYGELMTRGSQLVNEAP